jgi:hypothetical protein
VRRQPGERKTVDLVNSWVTGLLSSPRWGRRVGRSLTVITYVGRRSGRTFSIPVGYRRSAPDEVVIGVSLADAKSWWRNFLGEGGALTVRLDGVDRAGHGTATRDESGRVSVRVQLAEP